jgi:hypothetical protein
VHRVDEVSFIVYYYTFDSNRPHALAGLDAQGFLIESPASKELYNLDVFIMRSRIFSISIWYF